MGLKFHRLVKVAGDCETTEVSLRIDRGYVRSTKLDDETSLPEYTIHIPIGIR